jgi:hypothetical protein
LMTSPLSLRYLPPSSLGEGCADCLPFWQVLAGRRRMSQDDV